MNIARLARIPNRCLYDIRIISILRNWQEAIAAEWNGSPLRRLEFRNGVVLDGPETIDLAFLFHEIWVKRMYSPPGYEIDRGDVVVDIGANIGVFAAYAATCAPEVKVASYEPFPENVSWLRKNIEESGLSNVTIYQQAVASHTGQRTLQVSPNWIAHALNDSEEGLTVDCVGLNEVMNEMERCDLLKIDCEGSEYEILQNCDPEVLGRVRRIVGEYHEGRHIEGTGRELSRFLESRSFKIDRLEYIDVNCGILCARNTRIPGQS